MAAIHILSGGQAAVAQGRACEKDGTVHHAAAPAGAISQSPRRRGAAKDLRLFFHPIIKSKAASGNALRHGDVAADRIGDQQQSAKRQRDRNRQTMPWSAPYPAIGGTADFINNKLDEKRLPFTNRSVLL